MSDWSAEIDPQASVNRTADGRVVVPVNVFLDQCHHVARVGLALTDEQIELIYAAKWGLLARLPARATGLRRHEGVDK